MNAPTQGELLPAPGDERRLDTRQKATALAVASGGNEIAQMLQLAIDKNVPVESIEKLVTLYERVADRQAARSFSEALADFQRVCPSIKKTSTANVATKSGAKFSYKYAELDEIAATVAPLLGERGLAFSWDSCVSDKGILSCTCTLRHIAGHSITATFSCPTDSEAGMSPQQKSAAALTFARRQSLVQVMGLTTTDADTDGRSPEDLEFIDESQAADLVAKVQEVGGKLPAFLKALGVDRIGDIRVHQLKGAYYMLEQKRGAR